MTSAAAMKYESVEEKMSVSERSCEKLNWQMNQIREARQSVVLESSRNSSVMRYKLRDVKLFFKRRRRERDEYERRSILVCLGFSHLGWTDRPWAARANSFRNATWSRQPMQPMIGNLCDRQPMQPPENWKCCFQFIFDRVLGDCDQKSNAKAAFHSFSDVLAFCNENMKSTKVNFPALPNLTKVRAVPNLRWGGSPLSQTSAHLLNADVNEYTDSAIQKLKSTFPEKVGR